MPKNKLQRLVFYVSLFLCGVSFLVVSIEIFSYQQEQNHRIKIEKNKGEQTAIRSSKQIQEKLLQLQNTANSIASDLSSGTLTDDQALERAKKELEQNPDFLEVGLAYKPFAYKPNIRLYAPYYTRKNGRIERKQIEKFYDYTKPLPKNDWYHKSLADGSIWVEPYFDDASKDIIIDYDVTFYRTDPTTKKKTPVGVVFANYSVNKAQDFINSLDLGKSGYGVLISKKGVILAHPNQECVKKQKTIFQIAKELKRPEIGEIGEKAIKGEKAVIEYENVMTGQDSWAFIEPIPLTGWSMVSVVIKDESIVDNKARRQDLIRITLEVIIGLFCLSIIIFRANRGSLNSLWAVSSTLSFLCLAGIGVIWFIALREHQYKHRENLLLTQEDVNNSLKTQDKPSEPLKQQEPLYIPTGIFIQSIKFNGANDVFVNGYIWQKYYDNIPDGLSPDFILPEGYETEIKEAYRYKKDNIELIGWYFETKLRQNFDFSKYPFDANDVWIRLWPKDFHHNGLNRDVILVPDLTSYDIINPLSQPGLERDFVLGGWTIESSFFEYKFNTYNSNFGFGNAFTKNHYPELYFTVILKRDFIGIFIARVVPLLVVAILLFCMMPLSRDHGMEIVGACAGLIFVIILDQISVRGQIATQGIIYFEYFYFVMYFLILLVAANAILLKLNKNIPLILYKNNRIPKLFYWPTLLGILLIITAFTFCFIDKNYKINGSKNVTSSILLRTIQLELI
ncbi:MAG TPA: hypothetical protein DCL61_26965 [Cyanobacteria bacterium UBA12227]|nr:hypothetical protein [Cyanobacteria bacterium UBA12227]HAX90025.1 hypothetical protein [Cyanobacteria bacterium UBA11370]HBY78032.1 hypothetical protein [Cyanobacteria bacterium UBA11148]